MINEDNTCIRYLMKEMDPSEEMLMERAMMEDDDLLIEVECMRQTLKRLDKLPRVNPPAHLTNSIIRQAVEHRQKTLGSSRIFLSFTFKYAAAALVVIGTAVGGFMVYDDYTNVTPDEPARLTAAREAETGAPDALQNIQVIQTSDPEIDNSIDPWVDRNDVIYFRDQYSKDSSAFESLIKSSTEKLTPLNDSFIFNTGTRSLQLTGSGTSH